MQLIASLIFMFSFRTFVQLKEIRIQYFFLVILELFMISVSPPQALLLSTI